MEERKLFYNHMLDWDYGDCPFQMDTDLFWKLADAIVAKYPDGDRDCYRRMKRRIKAAEKKGIHFVENFFEEYLVTRKVVNDYFAEYKTAYPFWGRGSAIEERFLGLSLTNGRHFIREMFKRWFPRGKNHDQTVEVFLRVLDDYNLCETIFDKCWMPDDEDED